MGIVLAVDGARLNRQIYFREIHRRGVHTQAAPHQHPVGRTRQTKVDPLQISRSLYVADIAKIDVACAHVARRENPDVHFLDDEFLVSVANGTVEHGVHMLRVLDQIGRVEQRQFGNTVGDNKGREREHLDIATLRRRNLAALGDQSRARAHGNLELA